MSGDIVIGLNQLEALIRKVNEASKADLFEILDAIGQQQEDSARKRIAESKKAPEGKRWDAWSSKYAKTRKPHHSLLRDTGALLDSLTHVVDESSKSVSVGSNLVYAAVHLFGSDDGTTPARSFLDIAGGFSDARDREEIRDIVRDFLGEIL